MLPRLDDKLTSWFEHKVFHKYGKFVVFPANDLCKKNLYGICNTICGLHSSYHLHLLCSTDLFQFKGTASREHVKRTRSDCLHQYKRSNIVKVGF